MDLPNTLKIHPVFDVSMLKPYHEDTEDQSRGESIRSAQIMNKSYVKRSRRCSRLRWIKRGVCRRTHFLIKWKGLTEAKSSWELEDKLWQFREQLKALTTQGAHGLFHLDILLDRTIN